MKRQLRPMMYLALALAISPSLVLFQNCGAPFKPLESLSSSSLAAGVTQLPATPPKPTLAIQTLPAMLTKLNSYSTQITITDRPAGSLLECELDGAAITPCDVAQPITLANLADGNHTLRIALKSQEDSKVLAEAGASWMVDATAPTLSFGGTPPLETSMKTYSFSAQAVDQGSGVAKYECSFQDQAFAACAFPVAGAVAVDGNYTFKVRAYDRAENVSAVANYAWTVRPDLPSVKIDKMPDAFNRVQNFGIEFSGTQGANVLTSFECSQTEAGAFTVCTSPFNVVNRFSAPRVFRVRGIGLNGVISSVATYRWVDDQQAPALSITSVIPQFPAQFGSTFYTSQNAQTFAFTATDANGIKTLECAIDAAAYAPCVTSVAYANLAEGSHTFRVRAYDNAGNVTLVTRVWVIDRTAPQINKIRYSGYAALNDGFPSTGYFAAQVDDVFFGKMLMSVNGGAYTTLTRQQVSNGGPGPVTGNWYGSLPATGELTVYIRGEDAVGNQTAPLGPYQFNFTPILPRVVAEIPSERTIDGLKYQCAVSYVVDNTAGVHCVYLNVSNPQAVIENTYFFTYDTSVNPPIERSSNYFPQRLVSASYASKDTVQLVAYVEDNRRYIIGYEYHSFINAPDGTLNKIAAGPTGPFGHYTLDGGYGYSIPSTGNPFPVPFARINFPGPSEIISNDIGSFAAMSPMGGMRFVGENAERKRSIYRVEAGRAVLEHELNALTPVNYYGGKLSFQINETDEVLTNSVAQRLMETTALRESRLPAYSPRDGISIGNGTGYSNHLNIYRVANNQITQMYGTLVAPNGYFTESTQNSNLSSYNDQTKTLRSVYQSPTFFNEKKIYIYTWQF